MNFSVGIFGVWLDTNNHLYLPDFFGNVIWKMQADGTLITTFKVKEPVNVAIDDRLYMYVTTGRIPLSA